MTISTSFTQNSGMQQQLHTLVLKWAKLIAPGVRHLAFTLENGKSLDFTPGQFVTVHFEAEGRPFKRSYSIASIPGSDDTIDFAASYVEGGVATQLLFNLEPGQTIQASGPFGRLILRDEKPVRYILVATGTGVTPYRSMLPEIERRIKEHNTKTVILQGVRQPDDLLYTEDFQTLAKRHPQFTFHAYYSRVKPEENNGFEKHGYVQEGFQHLDLNPATDIIYLCGNPNMIDQAFALLKEKGFEQHAVRREKYISAR